MNRLSHDRNGTGVFARRTQKNLDFIVDAAAKKKDVHPVTQAVSALLGIVVFPWQKDAFNNVKRQKLPVLTAAGWPKWPMEGSLRVKELGELIDVLRNAVAHGDIEFDSDSRVPSEVTVTFINTPNGTGVPNWKARIKADHLIEFCRCFSTAMQEQTGYVDK